MGNEHDPEEKVIYRWSDAGRNRNVLESHRSVICGNLPDAFSTLFIKEKRNRCIIPVTPMSLYTAKILRAPPLDASPEYLFQCTYDRGRWTSRSWNSYRGQSVKKHERKILDMNDLVGASYNSTRGNTVEETIASSSCHRILDRTKGKGIRGWGKKKLGQT